MITTLLLKQIMFLFHLPFIYRYSFMFSSFCFSLFNELYNARIEKLRLLFLMIYSSSIFLGFKHFIFSNNPFNIFLGIALILIGLLYISFSYSKKVDKLLITDKKIIIKKSLNFSKSQSKKQNYFPPKEDVREIYNGLIRYEFIDVNVKFDDFYKAINLQKTEPVQLQLKNYDFKIFFRLLEKKFKIPLNLKEFTEGQIFLNKNNRPYNYDSVKASTTYVSKGQDYLQVIFKKTLIIN